MVTDDKMTLILKSAKKDFKAAIITNFKGMKYFIYMK